MLCSPTGMSRLFHHEGERAVARAAARAGTYYSLSTLGTCSIEEVAAAVYLKPGDVMELGIEGLGVQRQTTKAAK